jgi:hypothetical protein
MFHSVMIVDASKIEGKTSEVRLTALSMMHRAFRSITARTSILDRNGVIAYNV